MKLRKEEAWRLNAPSGSTFILLISENWERSFAVDMIALVFGEGLNAKAATGGRVFIRRRDADDTKVW